jgi:hypothetical protein
MDTESTATPSRRPRTSLLVLLGIVVAVAAWMTLQDSAGPAGETSNPRRPQPQAGAAEALDPTQLDVRLEALRAAAPKPDNTDRNPFRFQPKAPPPAPPDTKPFQGTKMDELGPPPPTTTVVPPIPLKFIGIIAEIPNVGKVAALTDCRHTVQGTEGQEVDGRYRIVKIGTESLIIEYLDGKGRTTLRMSGQECVK